MNEINNDHSEIYNCSLDKLDHEINSILDKLLSTSRPIRKAHLTVAVGEDEHEGRSILSPSAVQIVP